MLVLVAEDSSLPRQVFNNNRMKCYDLNKSNKAILACSLQEIKVFEVYTCSILEYTCNILKYTCNILDYTCNILKYT